MKFFTYSPPAFLLVPSTEKYEQKWRHVDRLYARYKEIQSSEYFERYKELNDYVSSPEYKEELAQILALKYHGSKEEKMERRVAELRKYPEVKHYRKTGDTGSEYVKEYLDLQEHIHTPSFKKHKAYLKDKKRHLQSDPHQKFLEYKRLAKSKDIKSYFHLHKKYASLFAEIEKAKVLFDDEFRSTDRAAHWSVNPLQSEYIFSKAYSQNDEMHCVTPGTNVEQRAGTLRILTRQEEIKSMAWDKNHGFFPRQYHYTSGLVSTVKNFQLQKGTIEIKVRFTNVKNVYHSLWMNGEIRLPFLSCFIYCNKMLEMGMYAESGEAYSKVKKIAFNAKKFYVMSIEINENVIVWRINGKKISECSNKLTTPLSIGLASGIVGETNNAKLPAVFEIDWIRVFDNPIVRRKK